MLFTPFSRFLAAARHQPVDYVPAVGAISDFYLAPLFGIVGVLSYYPAVVYLRRSLHVH